MQINDKNYSLEEISTITKISVTNLKNLSEKKWDRLKKTQVYGFIQIIEREFKTDLSDLKAEAERYYQENQERFAERPIDLVDVADAGINGGKIISNILAFISIAAIAYAGWYYFAKDSKNLPHPADHNRSQGLFSETIDSAKKLLGGDKEKNSTGNKTAEKAATLPAESNPAKRENTKEHKKFDTVTEEKNRTQKSEIEKNLSIKKEVNKLLISQNESSAAQKQAESNNSNPESTQNSIAAKLSENNNSQIDKKEENISMLPPDMQKTGVNSSETNSSTLTEDNSSQAEQNSTITSADSNSSAEAAAIAKAVMRPKAKRLWVGIYNLNSHKRTVHTISKPLDLNIGEDTLAIVTGHNKFSVTAGGIEKDFSNGKTHRIYLIISKDGIKEINKKEYRKITKKRAW